MTKQYIEKQMAKAGLRLFKRYLMAVYHISYETFKTWSIEEQESALKDFFSE